jgi:hypothetical protein
MHRWYVSKFSVHYSKVNQGLNIKIRGWSHCGGSPPTGWPQDTFAEASSARDLPEIEIHQRDVYVFVSSLRTFGDRRRGSYRFSQWHERAPIVFLFFSFCHLNLVEPCRYQGTWWNSYKFGDHCKRNLLLFRACGVTNLDFSTQNGLVKTFLCTPHPTAKPTQQARENDVQNLAEEMEAEIQQDSHLDAEVSHLWFLWFPSSRRFSCIVRSNHLKGAVFVDHRCVMSTCACWVLYSC